MLPSVEGLMLADPTLIGKGSFIGGVDCARSRNELVVTNPANNGCVRRVIEATDVDIEQALESAASAFRVWRNVAMRDRSIVLRKWQDLVLENKMDLARILVLEGGKVLAEAVREIEYAASYINWFSIDAEKGFRTAANEMSPGTLGLVTREPIGVCVAITPWNFPCAMLARKVAPALAAGCTVIAKPSENTPLSAMALAELANRAGIPAGGFNVIVSSRARHVAEMLLASPVVRMLTFTGSTRVGKSLSILASARVMRTCMELGGLAPFIVFEDCDIAAAVDGLMVSKFRHSGQTCISTQRVFVQDGELHDKFVEALQHRMASELVMGNGLSPSVNIAPLINAAAVMRVSKQVDDAISKGAKLVYGGRDLSALLTQQSQTSSNNFYPPSLLTGATDEMDIAKTETFGPVVAVFRFFTESEVIERANACEAGLAAYVYTGDVGRAMRLSRALEYGMVGLNTSSLSDCRAEFGGIKESGLGREGGASGIEEFLQVKYSLLKYPTTQL